MKVNGQFFFCDLVASRKVKIGDFELNVGPGIWDLKLWVIYASVFGTLKRFVVCDRDLGCVCFLYLEFVDPELCLNGRL